MSDKTENLGVEIKQGIEALHTKIEEKAAASEVEEIKTKVANAVQSFETMKQANEAKAQGENERMELIEQHLAKLNLKGDTTQVAHDVKGWVEGALKEAKTTGELPLHELKTRTATDGASGGNLITEDLLYDQLISYMRDDNPIMREATVITRDNTNAFNVPVKELRYGSGAVGELQEGLAGTGREVKLVNFVMTRYYGEEPTTEEFLTAQNLEDESTIAADIMSDIGWQIGYDCLWGDGVSKPFGIFKESFLYETAFKSGGQAGNPTLPTWTDFLKVQLQFNYQRYVNNGKFHLSMNALVGLLTEKDNEGRPLYGVGINGNAPSTIGGTPFVIYPDMPKSLAANAAPVLFGDMKRAYLILLRRQFKAYRDELSGRRKGIINIGMSTFAGGGVKDKEAIRAIVGK